MALQVNETLIFHYLDTNGDGTGAKSAVGNYAVTADQFYYECPTGKTAEINRMLVYIEDAGTFDSGDYGNGLALTNGLTLKVLGADDTVQCDMTAGLPVKQNGHWARLCYDANHQNYGVGNEYIAVRWTFSQTGRPLTLDACEKLVLTVNDDFTGLVDHTFHIQGKYK